MNQPSPAADLRRAFPWLIGGLIAIHACMSVTRVAASLWVLHQGHGEWAVGVLLSLFAVAPMVLAMWAGRQADRYGLHRPVGIAVLMGLVGALVALLGQGLWTIGFSCLLSGGALSVAAVAMQREGGQMADEPSELKRVFGWMALGPALSNALSPVAAGVLIDYVSFRAAFGLAVVLPILAWVMIVKVPRHTPKPHSAASRAKPAWDLLRQPALRYLLLLNVVLASAWDAHSFVVPVIGHAKGLSASSIGLVLASFSVAAMLVRLAIIRWSKQLDEVTALRVAMLMATATLAVYAWLPGTAGLMLGSALLGLALGSVQPMVMAMLHQVTPADRHGQALGLRMVATNGATVAMPIGFGLLAAASVSAAPLWLMAGILLLAQWPARMLRSEHALLNERAAETKSD
ncbi:MFS transporter [Roseateles oligotrophus]|uniref:MFS transporter n=1 Tax=Roseateles oligotrophus TaxID=1769250 RepID=A0ABT2YJ80_9BURK|nr:MFS transporter [Roseateles oligotrophus]MCV2370113.1 MFS transporter [Roseateles oligotrophus]